MLCVWKVEPYGQKLLAKERKRGESSKILQELVKDNRGQ